MSQNDRSRDEARILEIIDDMFRSISWNQETPPDLDRFSAAVRQDAVIVPSARPVATTDIAAFGARMRKLHVDQAMRDFTETAGKTIVHLFGNLAVAIGAFEALADGSSSRGVNGFLFVREEDDWQIAAMAWDNEGPDQPLPQELL